MQVPHACKIEHLNLPDRVFERNPKHDLIVENNYIAGLDLSDEEAQEVLDLAVQPDKEKRLYGYCPRTGKFYVFPPHTDSHYHAYPIDIGEIRSRKQVLRQLADIGILDVGDLRKSFLRIYC